MILVVSLLEEKTGVFAGEESTVVSVDCTVVYLVRGLCPEWTSQLRVNARTVHARITDFILASRDKQRRNEEKEEEVS